MGADTDRMRKSSVPFGMNSPRTNEESQNKFGSSKGFRTTSGNIMSPNYDTIKSQYTNIKSLCEKSKIPFSPEQRKISGIEARQSNAHNLASSYKSTFHWRTPTIYR
jgi:hypothetical protein